MKHANTCNNCHHFHADPEQEGIFGDCRKNAPVPMPQEVAGSQAGYSRTIYMGTWPAVFADDVCSQHTPPGGRHPRSTANEEHQPEAEVLRGGDQASEAASVIVGNDGEILKVSVGELERIVIDVMNSEETQKQIASIINDEVNALRNRLSGGIEK